MSILWAANELESFTYTGTFSARAECENGFTGSTRGMGMTTGVATATFAGQTDIWVAVTWATSLVTTGSAALVQLKDSVAGRVMCQIDMDTYGWSLEYWDGAAYTEITGPWPNDIYVTFTNCIRITIHVKIHASTGVMEYWLDDSLMARRSGVDTTTGSVTQVDQVILQSPHASASTFSELIVSDKPTWWKRVATLLPTGNSATNTAWTGDYTGIDEFVVSDADTITDDANGDVETFTKAALATQPANMIAETVIVAFRGQNSGTGSANNIQACIRSGSTNYFGSSVSGISTTLSPYQTQWTTDPNTSAAWTNANINSAEIGVKAVT